MLGRLYLSITNDVKKNEKKCVDHRLRGSASTVLTATGQVNGI